MYVLENPVLQRELLVNLRMRRAFVILFLHLAVLGTLVYLSWPAAGESLDLSRAGEGESQELVNLFFLGQFLLISLMVPTFASGAFSGEKERKTFEMLVASPLRPGAIILGKMLASLLYLAILVFASLPIVVLCLPLGGVSIYEVLAEYFVLFLAAITFTMISLASSSIFQRSASALVVSYLLILPMALFGALVWFLLSTAGGSFRLFAAVTLAPGIAVFLGVVLFEITSRRLLHPPDLGSEGKEVVDEDQEMQQAVGLVIQRGQFPDNLFAPSKRTDLLADGANPVFDKEMRSEIFSQGTLMLRVVIQASMALALPLMWFCFYTKDPQRAPWYVCYVLLFNMLVGPVFSAGSVTGERERQTLELLLTTILSPWEILWAKLVAGLRVSCVLTMFLVWPLLLACVMVAAYWRNIPSMLLYIVIIIAASVTTANVALFCSVLARKTSISLVMAYIILLLLFLGPWAVSYYVGNVLEASPAAIEISERLSFTSPFTAAQSVPLVIDGQEHRGTLLRIPLHWHFLGFCVLLNAALLAVMSWLFQVRWRVAS